MATKPNEQQVAEEIKKLEDYKPRIKHYSFFGDDNRAALQAQIDVLKEGLDEDEIYARWNEGERDSNERSAALTALHWMETGETEDGETSLTDGLNSLLTDS